MDRSNPTRGWQLHLIRGLLYLLIGMSAFVGMTTFSGQSVQLIGGLLLAAGLCGCIYAVYTLRADRNYLWELLRSIIDAGIGTAALIFSRGEVLSVADIFGFWAVLYAFLQAVQAIYIFMLSSANRPRNISGNLLHLLSVLLAGGVAYAFLTSTDNDLSITLIGLLVFALGVIIIILAVQQRQMLLLNKF